LLRSTGFDLTAVARGRYADGRDELVFHWDPDRSAHHRPTYLPVYWNSTTL
jgi:hypothetical protein